MKSYISQLIPSYARKLILSWRTNRIQRDYATLTIAQTFDRVYETNAWGTGDAVTPNSGLGSSGRYVVEYCALIESLLREHNVRSVADLGCGNFNIGRIIATMVKSYIGVDIAQPVIDANSRADAGAHVRFVRADLTCDVLPPADVGIVRQVLQHLTNAEAAAALSNILLTYSLSIITEHIYIGPDAKPNMDIAHGPGTRVHMKSGIMIDLAPFSITAVLVGDIAYEPNEVLRTWLVQATHTRGSLLV